MNTILQVISDTNIGGGGRSLLNYLSCQDRSQFQSQVVLPRGSALKGPVEALGVPVHEIDAMADRSMDLSAVAPLRRAEGAILLDTTQLDLEESLQRLLSLVKERLDL